MHLNRLQQKLKAQSAMLAFLKGIQVDFNMPQPHQLLRYYRFFVKIFYVCNTFLTKYKNQVNYAAPAAVVAQPVVAKQVVAAPIYQQQYYHHPQVQQVYASHDNGHLLASKLAYAQPQVAYATQYFGKIAQGNPVAYAGYNH